MDYEWWMICCKGRYCLALVIIVFSWLFNLCKKYFVLRVYFHISCYHCVTCMLYCVTRFRTLPTRVLRFGTRPPKRPDRDIHSAQPPLFSASGSPLIGWRPRGLTFGSRVWFSSGTACWKHLRRPVGRLDFGRWLLWALVLLHGPLCVCCVPLNWWSAVAELYRARTEHRRTCAIFAS